MPLTAQSTAASPPIDPQAGAPVAAQFAKAMAGFAPFERAPVLAVAVSGGADSLGLCLLAAAWVGGRGGRVIALHVDHRLRPASGIEAQRVAGWLTVHDIETHILVRPGPAPKSGIEDAARRARYDLLGRWLADNGVLHLLVGHHRDDQAETVLMRLEAGSGVCGLAGMAGLAERPHYRLLRPLLGVPRRGLLAYLQGRGQPWLADPSNMAPEVRRAGLRRAAPQLAGAGLGAGPMTRLAGSMAGLRDDLGRAAAAAAGRWVRMHPAGLAWVDGRLLTAARPVCEQVLARLAAAIGGRPYLPPMDKISRLRGALAMARAGTVSGCVFSPADGGFRVWREARNLAPPVALKAGRAVLWDGRFDAVAAADTAPRACRLRLGALGQIGWNQVLMTRPDLRGHPVPAPARAALPALFDGDALYAVPHLGYSRGPGGFTGRLCFRPRVALSEGRFAVALPRRDTIC